MNKKVLAFLCVALLFVSGIKGMSTIMNAADVEGTITMDNGIKYVPYNISKYWSTTEKTAPKMDNYVFGGWYRAEDLSEKKFIALKEETITTDSTTGKANMEGTYAKFVSAYVLSVKAQIDMATQSAGAGHTNNASIRLISSVDSKDYQKVGFKVLLANKTPLYKDENGSPLETTQIYTGLKAGENGTHVEPSAIFGPQSAFLSIWRLDGIASVNDDKIINVTPYWITADGTRVEGLTKYVHVEDGYMGYISVPINLRTAKQIAAGMLTLTYPEGLELVANKVEFNGVFKEAEMVFHDDGTNTIQLVGNADEVNNNVTAEGIYANLRFTKGTSDYAGGGKGVFLNFQVGSENFCNWDEKIIDVDVWDIQY